MPIGFTDPTGGNEYGGYGPGAGGGPQAGAAGVASPYPADFTKTAGNLPFALRRRLGFAAGPGPSSQGESMPSSGSWLGTGQQIQANQKRWAGIPDPGATGYDTLTQLLRQRALNDYPAETQQYTTAADLESGGDPYVKAYGALAGRMKAGSDLSNSLFQAQYGPLMAKQQWQNQLRQMQLEQAFQERMLRMYGNQGSGFLSQLGGGIGGAIGGGLGGWLGKHL